MNPNVQQQGHPAEGRFKKGDLLEALDSIRISDKFSFFSRMDIYEPRIVVNNIGRIPFPLSEAHAQRIAAEAHQAPYGRGNETIVDPTVRKTWELNPDQFQIQAPNWEQALASITLQLTAELDLRCSVHAVLHKMLLYEEGAMFRAHTDTEKIPGMFGTLVISLPSRHKGGAVVVTHQDRSFRYKTSKYEMSFAFWFSDVSHEVLPVRSGYRWVLTYNIAAGEPTDVPSADNHVEQEAIRQVMEQWSQEVQNIPRAPSPLFYLLDHKYTEANISYEGLRPIDQGVVKALRNVCPDLGFDLFLTTLNKKEIGIPKGFDYDHPSGWGNRKEFHKLDVVDYEYSLKYVFDLDGTEVASDVRWDNHNLLQEDSFSSEPDEKGWMGYMGNWGPEETHWYIESALIIIPSRGTVSFLTRTSHLLKDFDLSNVCSYLLGEKSSSAQLYEFLRSVCYKPMAPSYTLAGDTLLKALQKAVRNQHPQSLDLIMAENKHPIPLDFFPWMKVQYKSSRISAVEFERVINHALDSQITLHRKHQALLAIEDEIGGFIEDETLFEIIFSARRSYLNSDITQWYFAEDGSAFLEMTLKNGDFSYLENHVSPMVEQWIKCTPFALGFLVSLHQMEEHFRFTQDETERIFRRLARLAIHHLEVDIFTAWGAPDVETVKADTLPSSLTNLYMPPETMEAFVTSLAAMGLGRHLEQFAEKIASQYQRINGQDLHDLWVPLLQALMTILPQHNIEIREPHWMDLYQKIFNRYPLMYLGPEPQEQTLERPAVPCYCRDCNDLNAFLTDPDTEVDRFSIGKGRRQHLHEMLDEYLPECKHETERWGNPQTLVVTKAGGQAYRDVESWNERKVMVREKLEEFDQAMLHALLGPYYAEVALNSYALGSAPIVAELRRPDPNRPAGSGSRVPPPVAGVKREHSEI
ncbi:hypothetical protein M426DRAFT_8531 [Hypoxylon sp. CI-4A]|nr:hypothetical protein M426DRAFT_8531 [Hypoxylon sp. CI-4A]